MTNFRDRFFTRIINRLQARSSWLWQMPLGLVFIYAAWGKIQDPAAFAITLDNYRLLPLTLIGPLAILLPWLEMVAGILVTAGLWKREAALILGILLIIFMTAVSFNLARGLDFDCGCFGSGQSRGAFSLLWQDALLLVCAAMVIIKPKKRA